MGRTDSAGWKLRRLLAMSPAEVGLRIARGVARRRSRPDSPVSQAELVTAGSVLVEEAADADAWLARRLDEERGSLLRGAAEPEELARALAALGTSVDETVRAADSVLEGRLPAFGWTTIDAGPEPDWLVDPSSGTGWPLVFWADLDFRGTGAPGDPRYVWEVNRHHHLVTLARAHLLTGNARYAERIWSDVRSWVESNPPLFGINWASPLEIAIRLMSWAMAVDIVGAAGARNGDAALMTASVSLQVRQLSDNLSVYASSRNNHLIGEAAGLLVAGAKFACVRGTAELAGRGRAILERELAAQVTADGVNREQAFQYQTFVLEFGLLGAAAAASLGTSLAPQTVGRLDRMASFLAAVSGRSGLVPSVGDEDGGRAYDLGQRPGRQAMCAVAAASALAGGLMPDCVEREDLAPALWFGGPSVLGILGDRSARSSDVGRGPAPAFFPEGGYFVAGGGDHLGLVDCGSLGYLSIAAHGHADCLSLSISHRGEWVVVDPGTFCYHRDPEWRDHFRGTRAHNTVAVDALDQSEMLGPFMWGRRAAPAQKAWVSNRWFDFFEGAHDGYLRPSGVVHTRSVLFGRPGYWLVVDRIEGEGRHEIAATFQMAEGFSPLPGSLPEGGAPGDRVRFAGDGGAVVEFTRWLPEGAGVDVAEGREAPPSGWVSRGFGHRSPAPALIAAGRIELPATLVFGIAVGAGAPGVSFRRLDSGSSRGAAVEVAHAEGRDVVLVGEVGRAVGDSGEWEFVGTLGFVRLREDPGAALGLGIRNWKRDGTDVGFESAADLLRS